MLRERVLAPARSELIPQRILLEDFSLQLHNYLALYHSDTTWRSFRTYDFAADGTQVG